MAVEIKCSVANCEFWQEMYCVARDIEVNCNDGGTEADQSESTCCDTFRPRPS
jgi:hypothetical protein